MKIPLCQLTLLDRGFLPVGHVLRMRRGPGREPVTAQRRHQVTDIAPAPAPKITEYVAQAKECAGCGTVTAGELPAHVRAQASYGPETCAQAANLAIGHIPIYRATLLLCQLAGIAVSTGWMAGIRGKAQALAASGLAANLCLADRHREGRPPPRPPVPLLRGHDPAVRRPPRPGHLLNYEAERTIRPVKVKQRGSGGCWRTRTGLAEFALVQSYLSTAAKWGISKLDALRALFNGNAWLPPGLEPTG